MPADTPADFDQFCRFNRNITDIHRWLTSRGYKVGWQAVRSWWHASRQAGEQARMLNSLSETYEGLESDRILQAAGMATSLLVKGVNQTQDYLNNLPPEDALKILQLTAGWIEKPEAPLSKLRN